MACGAGAIWLTAKVVGWSLLLQLTLGAWIAWILARSRLPGRTLLDLFVTLPLVFPPIVLGYALLVALGQQGWLTGWLPPAWRPDIVFSLPGLVLAAFVAGLPLMVKTVQAALLEVPDDLHAAAATLRQSRWSIFWRIDMPLARRGVVAGVILSGGRAMGEVGMSIMLGGNIAGRTETVSLAIYNHVLDGEFACANTLTLLLAGVACLCFFLLKRYGAI